LSAIEPHIKRFSLWNIFYLERHFNVLAGYAMLAGERRAGFGTESGGAMAGIDFLRGLLIEKKSAYDRPFFRLFTATRMDDTAVVVYNLNVSCP